MKRSVIILFINCLLNLPSSKSSFFNNFKPRIGKIINEVSSRKENIGRQIQNPEHETYNKFDNVLEDLTVLTNNGYVNEMGSRGDEMCERFGRCGCRSSERCGNNKDIDKVIDDVNKQILKDLKKSSLKYEEVKSKEENYINNKIRNKEVLVVVMKPTEVKGLLQSQRFKRKRTKNLLESIIYEILDLAKVGSNEIMKLKRSRIPFSPKEITKYYNEFKDEVVNRIFKYVKNIPPKKPLPYLTLKPRWEFKRLKEMYKQNKMKDSELKRVILDMLLGDNSNMKIYPHKNRNAYEIVVPKWVYLAFYKMRKYQKHGFE
ncbi:unnamed protein product [Pieris macdunnoughi]|uniref:Uncharacterized protein n=1 Tax=Pieris macdunnoughi TaxID=345717 RepID=A0A821SVD7_9NEOP|nr:unnamed protein product [Pieris macdunnoughi]